MDCVTNNDTCIHVHTRVPVHMSYAELVLYLHSYWHRSEVKAIVVYIMKLPTCVHAKCLDEVGLDLSFPPAER